MWRIKIRLETNDSIYWNLTLLFWFVPLWSLALSRSLCAPTSQVLASLFVRGVRSTASDSVLNALDWFSLLVQSPLVPLVGVHTPVGFVRIIADLQCHVWHMHGLLKRPLHLQSSPYSASSMARIFSRFSNSSLPYGSKSDSDLAPPSESLSSSSSQASIPNS
jgi:hypothetical protein